MTARRPLLVLGLLAAAILVAGCTPQTEAAPVEQTPIPTTTPDSPPSAEPTPTADAAEPACDTIIPQGAIDEFAALGWVPMQEPFIIGSTTLENGLVCKWGDPSLPSDHVQIFGWAALDPTEATTAQLDLVEGGWRQEDAPEGVYITENAETASGTDDEGYGWTYLFGDGWVKFADTKQSLLLVEWPPA